MVPNGSAGNLNVAKVGPVREFVSNVESVKTRAMTCEHSPGKVLLRGYRQLGKADTHLSLSPSRGFESSDYVIGAGWNSIAFPNYEVLRGGLTKPE